MTDQKKLGRPVGSHKWPHRINVYLSDEDRALVDKARGDVSISRYVRDAVVAKAKRRLK
jgi:hypothetical protein